MTAYERRYGRGIKPMTSSEYEAMYGWGEYPERFWPGETRKLQEELDAGKLTMKEYADSLDDMMGITRMESRRGALKTNPGGDE